MDETEEEKEMQKEWREIMAMIERDRIKRIQEGKGSWEDYSWEV